MPSLKEIVDKKHVLFITTKNLDYIRNSQEIHLLKELGANVEVIGSASSSYAKRLFHVYWRLLTISVKRFDIVFAGFSPQLIVPFWRWKFRHKILIEDFFISLYDTLVHDRQKFRSSGFIGRLLHRLDANTLSGADLIICDTKAHGQYFSTEFGQGDLPLLPLYLEADRSIYYPRDLHHTDHRLHVLYFGSILPLQGLPVILDAIRLLLPRRDIEFTIIGPIPKDMNPPVSDRIHYIPWLSQQKLAEEIAMADLCLAGHFHPSIAKASRTIPGKAYIYEAMNKPMILGDNPATRERETKWTVPTFYVPMGDAAALADCILAFKSSNLLYS